MVMAFIDLFKNTQNDEVEEELRGEIMKKLLAKYGRHFWIVSLSVTFMLPMILLITKEIFSVY